MFNLHDRFYECLCLDLAFYTLKQMGKTHRDLNVAKHFPHF